MKAESKTKEFILFFTEAHPNFLSRREKKLVKAERNGLMSEANKTKEFILFFTEAHPNFTERSEVKLVHELLSIAKINEVNDFWIPKNIRKDESTRKSFWIISIFSTSFGINKTLIARITLIKYLKDSFDSCNS